MAALELSSQRAFPLDRLLMLADDGVALGLNQLRLHHLSGHRQHPRILLIFRYLLLRLAELHVYLTNKLLA
jgi:hypothetical protein